MNDAETIKDRHRKRLAFLRFLYDDAQKVPEGRMSNVAANDVEAALRIDSDERSRIEDYLNERGLLKMVGGGPLLAITAAGVDYVEHAFGEPDRPTEYFPPVNVLFVERMDNSQIQQGTVSSTQSGDWRGLSGQDLSSLVRELEPLVTALAGASRDELSAWLDTLKAQSRIASPSKSVVREALTTMRGIAEKVGASLIAAKITAALAAAAIA